MDSLEVATFCAKAAAEKRARDVLVLDIRTILGVADYFVLATARNKRQIKAIANAVRVGLKEHGELGLSSEGIGTERWVLLDYANVVVHLFDPEARAYYDLEALWADARRVPVDLPVFAEGVDLDQDPMDEFAELGESENSVEGLADDDLQEDLTDFEVPPEMAGWDDSDSAADADEQDDR